PAQAPPVAPPGPAPGQPQPPPVGHQPGGARMESLQAALSSIRDRVQSLGTAVGAEAHRTAGPPPPVDLTLYRQASEERTLAEVRRHSRESEDQLKRMSENIKDLSKDLRSIVEAARRAIDQTSEQADSSVELGRLLGERMEQLDEQVAAR